MRWKKKQVEIDGKRRAKIKFALLPKRTNDNYVIWFEKYLSFEEYHFPVLAEISPYWVELTRWSKNSTMWAEWNEKI